MDTGSRVIGIAPDGDEVVHDPLRNSADELRALEDERCAKLAELIQAYSLVVVGYSAVTKTVMSTLRERRTREKHKPFNGLT